MCIKHSNKNHPSWLHVNPIKRGGTNTQDVYIFAWIESWMHCRVLVFQQAIPFFLHSVTEGFPNDQSRVSAADGLPCMLSAVLIFGWRKKQWLSRYIYLGMNEWISVYCSLYFYFILLSIYILVKGRTCAHALYCITGVIFSFTMRSHPSNCKVMALYSCGYIICALN